MTSPYDKISWRTVEQKLIEQYCFFVEIYIYYGTN